MIRVVHPGSGSRMRILTFYPSRIPDPGVKKAPDPGSGSVTLYIKVWSSLPLLYSHGCLVPGTCRPTRAERRWWSWAASPPATRGTSTGPSPRQDQYSCCKALIGSILPYLGRVGLPPRNQWGPPLLADGHLVRGPHWFLGGRPTGASFLVESCTFHCLVAKDPWF